MRWVIIAGALGWFWDLRLNGFTAVELRVAVVGPYVCFHFRRCVVADLSVFLLPGTLERFWDWRFTTGSRRFGSRGGVHSDAAAAPTSIFIIFCRCLSAAFSSLYASGIVCRFTCWGNRFRLTARLVSAFLGSMRLH